MADRHSGTDREVNLAARAAAAMDQACAMAPARELPTTPATSGGNNWVPLGPLCIPEGQALDGSPVVVTGRVTEIVPHPTDPLTIYVASARGGVWKTTDGGVTWAPKSDHEASLAIGALALAPSEPHILYAGTGEGNIYYYATRWPLDSINATYQGRGILKSTDGGERWSLQGQARFTGACFFRIAVHPGDPAIAFAACSRGLFRTTDGGTNMHALTNTLPAIGPDVLACCDIALDPRQPSTAYAAFWGSGVYRSHDAAAANPTWEKLEGGLPTNGMGRIALAVSPTSPQDIYALVAGEDSLIGFFASRNGGATWIAVPTQMQVYAPYTLNVAVDSSTPDIVYLSGVSLHKAVRTQGEWSVTRDVGQKIHADHHALGRHPTEHRTIYAGTDGGVYRSLDGGDSWDDSINEGLCITQFEFIAQHPTTDAFVIGGTQDNGTVIFRNSPAFYASAGGDGGMAGIDPSEPRNVIHTYNSDQEAPKPMRSIQGGKRDSYTSIADGLGGRAIFYPPFDFDATNPQNPSSAIWLAGFPANYFSLVNAAHVVLPFQPAAAVPESQWSIARRGCLSVAALPDQGRRSICPCQSTP